jgi:hypothetical protein
MTPLPKLTKQQRQVLEALERGEQPFVLPAQRAWFARNGLAIETGSLPAPRLKGPAKYPQRPLEITELGRLAIGAA